MKHYLINKEKKKTDCQYRYSPKMLCVCICFIQLFLKHDLALKMFFCSRDEA